MADFTYDFSAQTTANPWTVPSPLIRLVDAGGGTRITNGSGVRPVNANSVLESLIAHNVSYGATIQTDFNFPVADVGSHFGDYQCGGVAVRSGANVGAAVGCEIQATEIYWVKYTGAGVRTQLGSKTGLTRAANDIFTVIYDTATGAITAKLNGTTLTPATGTNVDSTYAAEATLASAIWFAPGNNNGSFIKTFSGTGVAAGPTFAGAATESGSDTAAGTITTGPTFAGAATEGGADSASGSAFNFPTGAHHQYRVDSTTWRSDAGSLGSSLTGSPVTGDQVLLPTTSPDGLISYGWELDSNGNATGALASVSGITAVTGNNWGYWDSTTPQWFFSTFDTSLNAQFVGAATESGADTAAGTIATGGGRGRKRFHFANTLGF